MGEALFGIADHISSDTGTFAFFIVIATVVFVETIFHFIHKYSSDTAYHEMVAAIEKELMIVGCMAFSLKILFNTVHFESHHWVLAIEFADLTIPITSAVYCCIGFVLIIDCGKQHRIWSRGYNLKLVELLDEYFEELTPIKDWIRKYLYRSVADVELEFRIFHHVFCESYMIQRKAIEFDEYVRISYEKYLLGLVTISPTSWLILCTFLLLNYFRVLLHLNPLKCHHHVAAADATAEEIKEAQHAHHVCALENSVELFAIAGGFLLFTTISLYFLSRYYVAKLMEQRGVHSSDDFATFLQVLENEDNMVHDKDNLDTKQLLDALVSAKHQIDVEKIDKEAARYQLLVDIKLAVRALIMSPACMQWLYRLFTGVEYSARYDLQSGDYVSHLMSEKKLPVNHRRTTTLINGAPAGHGTKSHPSGIQSMASMRIDKDALLLSNHSEKPDAHATSSSRPLLHISSPPISTDSSLKDNHKRGTLVVGVASMKQLQMSNSMKDSNASTHGGTLDSELRHAFLFSHPEWYFIVVDSLIMLISFYNGLWLTNFYMVSTEVHNMRFWIATTIIPGLLSALLFCEMIKTSALLHAVVILDRESVEESIENAIDSKNLAEQLRSRLVEQLPISDLAPEVALKNLFNLIDENDNKSLTRVELKHYLQGLRVSLSQKKWDQIFHEIDRNFDNKIVFEELLLFVFPKIDVTKEAERKRMQAVGKRVNKAAVIRLANDDEFTQVMDRIVEKNNVKPIDRATFIKQLSKEHSVSMMKEGYISSSMKNISIKNLFNTSARITPSSASRKDSEDGKSDAEKDPDSVVGFELPATKQVKDEQVNARNDPIISNFSTINASASTSLKSNDAQPLNFPKSDEKISARGRYGVDGNLTTILSEERDISQSVTSAQSTNARVRMYKNDDMISEDME